MFRLKYIRFHGECRYGYTIADGRILHFSILEDDIKISQVSHYANYGVMYAIYENINKGDAYIYYIEGLEWLKGKVMKEKI